MNMFIPSAKGMVREVYIKQLLKFLKAINKRLVLGGFYQ